MFLLILFSAGAGIGIAGGVTGGAATISEKVVNSKQMKVAKEALISDQESTLELQSQIEALRLPSIYYISLRTGWVVSENGIFLLTFSIVFLLTYDLSIG